MTKYRIVSYLGPGAADCGVNSRLGKARLVTVIDSEAPCWPTGPELISIGNDLP
ncbi:hypothetical protein [Streptomyces sp. NBC_01304]|uniref:hypothetical protein n=1 Tax=Streptomyces sp. NBC_01304 TaxID=2903818 RepID=UPI002E0D9244|nr:hypothetical protein OG430_41545 [Streptomyces sp. NBC_01304]